METKPSSKVRAVMIKSKRFALMFRLCAMIFAATGVLKQIGAFNGKVALGAFMFYTILSNLLAVVMFAFLSIQMLINRTESSRGILGRYTRFEMVCAVDLLVTLMVFWILLVPEVPTAYLWTFDNIAVHTVTPLLCLIDYILFSEPGKIKYRDVYFVCIFPIAYVAVTSLAGIAGYEYRFSSTFGNAASEVIDTAPVRFPYFFLDYDRIGITALVYIVVLLAFFIVLSHIIFFIDRKFRLKK